MQLILDDDVSSPVVEINYLKCVCSQGFLLDREWPFGFGHDTNGQGHDRERTLLS